MADLDYHALYTLQDKVLSAVFAAETSFYLTGGTCLHRFYVQRRYSDDLDLFSNDNALFRDDVRIAQDCLNEKNIAFETHVDTRDFVRLLVDSTLQVDLVNDRVYRYGRSRLTEQGVVLDNIQNICANKICAVLGRDEPKDVFDLYIILQHMGIDWSQPIEAAGKKCVLDGEILEYRLSSFPLHLIDLLPIANQGYIGEMKENYKDFINKLTSMI